MSLNFKYKNLLFGIGDKVKITQKIIEQGKERKQTFIGIITDISGKNNDKYFTVRRIGTGGIGIEKIFPLQSPTIIDITLSREGQKGVRKANLAYIRKLTRKEIEKIYTRARRKK